MTKTALRTSLLWLLGVWMVVVTLAAFFLFIFVCDKLGGKGGE